MDTVQMQPWWQYEDDTSKYNVQDIEDGMNKEEPYGSSQITHQSMVEERTNAAVVAGASHNTSMTRTLDNLRQNQMGWQRDVYSQLDNHQESSITMTAMSVVRVLRPSDGRNTRQQLRFTTLRSGA
eukprot:5896542-Amphidinium_carterae.1